jgi:septum formation protein
MPTTTPQLILASTSPYRKELVSRWRVPFSCVSPLVDETPLAGESPLALAQRLALAKALAVAQQHPQAYVIGSDQVLDLGGEPLGKPHTHTNAVAMLRRMSGQTMAFHTAVAVVRGAAVRTGLDTVTVTMKPLTNTQIETYLQLDAPYDCAGSCKSESLGIALCARIDSVDPTSQIGLPLILTAALLSQLGYDILDHAQASSNRVQSTVDKPLHNAVPNQEPA